MNWENKKKVNEKTIDFFFFLLNLNTWRKWYAVITILKLKKLKKEKICLNDIIPFRRSLLKLKFAKSKICVFIFFCSLSQKINLISINNIYPYITYFRSKIILNSWIKFIYLANAHYCLLSAESGSVNERAKFSYFAEKFGDRTK